MKIKKSYYYYHLPTKKFVLLDCEGYYCVEGGFVPCPKIYAYLKSEFDPCILYQAKNILEESLSFAQWGDNPAIDEKEGLIVGYDFSVKTLNLEEFELMECSISYDY